jgi:16S rRNA (guanine966-N2)-methyltransferase
MRVIAGVAKGHPLKALRGVKLRPTSDLVRGVIFSMLESQSTDWTRVLDLYAGTGALGIEALSRGAGEADFVEKSTQCCAIIRENLSRTKLADRARVYCQDVSRALHTLSGPYGVILMDPPYADPSIGLMVERVGLSALLGPRAALVVEHSKRVDLPESIGSLELLKRRRHGDTVVSIYSLGG